MSHHIFHRSLALAASGGAAGSNGEPWPSTGLTLDWSVTEFSGTNYGSGSAGVTQNGDLVAAVPHASNPVKLLSQIDGAPIWSNSDGSAQKYGAWVTPGGKIFGSDYYNTRQMNATTGTTIAAYATSRDPQSFVCNDQYIVACHNVSADRRLWAYTHGDNSARLWTQTVYMSGLVWNPVTEKFYGLKEAVGIVEIDISTGSTTTIYSSGVAYGNSFMTALPDGGLVAVAGNIQNDRQCLVCLNSDGSLRWSRLGLDFAVTYGVSSSSIVHVAADPGGDIYIGSSGSANMIRLSSVDGSKVWTATDVGYTASNSSLDSMALSPTDGSLYVIYDTGVVEKWVQS